MPPPPPRHHGYCIRCGEAESSQQLSGVCFEVIGRYKDNVQPQELVDQSSSCDDEVCKQLEIRKVLVAWRYVEAVNLAVGSMTEEQLAVSRSTMSNLREYSVLRARIMMLSG